MRYEFEDLPREVPAPRLRTGWVAFAIVLAGVGAGLGLSQRIDSGATTLDVMTVRSALTQDQLEALRRAVVETAVRFNR